MNVNKFSLLLLFLISRLAFAVSPNSMTYEGILTDVSGAAVDLTGQTVTFSIVNASACVIYSETSVSSGDSGGNIIHKVGTGTAVFGSFDHSLFNSAKSGVGACAVTAAEDRYLQVSVGALSVSATVAVTSVPYALESTAVGGFSSTSLLRAVDISGNPTAIAALSPAQQTEFASLLAGTSSLFVKPSSANITAGTVGGSTNVNTTGSVSAASMSSSDFKLYQGANYITFLPPASLSSGYTLRWPADDGILGQVLTTDGAGILSWTSAASGDITDVTAGSGLVGGATSGSATLTVDTGTTAGKIVVLDGSARLPAVDGSQLTGLTTGQLASGTLPVSRGGTGATAFTANQVVISNFLGNLTTLACPAGQIVAANATSDVDCLSISDVGGFVQGGNTATGTLTIGTNSNHDFAFETNSVTRMYIEETGKVGVGTNSPTELLHVAGNLRVSGAIYTDPMSSGLTSVISFASSNTVHSTHDCNGGLVLNNLKDGGHYELLITDPSTYQCNFTTSGLTYFWFPANGPRTASTHTIYTLKRIGSNVYVSWKTGYQ